MKLKKLTIIGLAISYTLFLFAISSGTILSDIIKIRQNILSYSAKTETLILSKDFWEGLAEKKEFIYLNNYYDVKKVIIYKKFVKVEVVKDEFEQIIKEFSKNLNSKKQKGHSVAFKKIIVACFVNNTFNNERFSSDNIKNDFTPIPFKKNKFPNSIFRPPCII